MTLIAAGLLFAPACGRSQQLESITLIPSSVDFQGPLAQIQFKAIGNFIHPPQTKDITDEVQWSSNVTQAATIDATGLATAGNYTPFCGGGDITAVHSSNPSSSDPNSGSQVVATASFVNGTNGGICP